MWSIQLALTSLFAGHLLHLQPELCIPTCSTQQLKMNVNCFEGRSVQCNRGWRATQTVFKGKMHTIRTGNPAFSQQMIISFNEIFNAENGNITTAKRINCSLVNIGYSQRNWQRLLWLMRKYICIYAYSETVNCTELWWMRENEVAPGMCTSYFHTATLYANSTRVSSLRDWLLWNETTTRVIRWQGDLSHFCISLSSQIVVYEEGGGAEQVLDYCATHWWEATDAVQIPYPRVGFALVRG